MGEQALSAGVGAGQANVPADVMTVQGLLNEHPEVTGQTLVVDGGYGTATHGAIVAWQSVWMQDLVPDGVVSAGGATFASLVAGAAIAPVAVPALLMPQDPVPQGALEDEDYEAAAAKLGCEVAAIKAVAEVECSGKAFDAQGRPTILFERHLFSRATEHVYDATEPVISNKVRGGYGEGLVQYPKLLRAAGLGDGESTLDAALASASWGAFQILGQNCEAAGFADVEEYVAAMRTGIAAHLEAFVSFITANPKMLKAIQTKDWTGFAEAYNGAGTSGYDTKLAAAYAEIVAEGAVPTS